MSIVPLKKKIDALTDMEIGNYMMQSMEMQLNQRISDLGHPHSYSKPSMPPSKVMSDLGFVAGDVIGLSLGLGAVIGFVLGFLSCWDDFSNFFDMIVFAFYGALIGLAIGFVGMALYALIALHREKKKFAAKYDADMKQYTAALARDKARVERELQLKEALMAQRNALQKKRNESQGMLARFYQSAGIDERFQNLICMGYMSEFVRLGIATKLEGTDGLYYLILKELRYEQINVRLEQIITRLDELIDSQRDIYRELVRANNTCAYILQSTVQSVNSAAANKKALQQIAANTELMAYTSQRALTELEYRNYFLL